MSDLLKNITDAQLEIENAKYDATGQQGHRTFPYATLGECLDVVNAVLKPRGLVVWFDITDNNVVTVITDGKDEIRRAPFPVKFTDDPRANGSEVTYAKRYSLQAAFGITSEDDDGEAAQTAKNKPSSQKAVTTQKRQEDARKLAQNRLKLTLVEYYGGDKDEAKRVFESYWQYEGFKDEAEWFERKNQELLTELRSQQ